MMKFVSAPTVNLVFSESVAASGLPVQMVSIDGAAPVVYAQGAIAADGSDDVIFTLVSPNPLAGLGTFDFTTTPQDQVLPIGKASADGTSATFAVLIDGTEVDLIALNSTGAPSAAIPGALRPGGDLAVYDDGTLVLTGYACPGKNIAGADAGGTSGGPTANLVAAGAAGQAAIIAALVALGYTVTPPAAPTAPAS